MSTTTLETSSFHERLASVQDGQEQLMREIREAAAYLRGLPGDRRHSLTRLTTVTGLHKNSLIRLKDENWQPRGETLQALEKIVVRAEADRRGERFNDQPPARGRPEGSKTMRRSPPKKKPKKKTRGKKARSR